MDRIKFLHGVLDVVLRINGGAEKRNGKGHPTAFYYYSGHVNSIDVAVYPDGWVSSEEEPEQRCRRFDFDFHLYSDERNMKTLEELIDLEEELCEHAEETE